jgi:hypothetical protein
MLAVAGFTCIGEHFVNALVVTNAVAAAERKFLRVNAFSKSFVVPMAGRLTFSDQVSKSFTVTQAGQSVIISVFQR